MSEKFHEILQYQFHENLFNGFLVMYTTYVQSERGTDLTGFPQICERFCRGFMLAAGHRAINKDVTKHGISDDRYRRCKEARGTTQHTK
jgi:hypothetical protein